MFEIIFFSIISIIILTPTGYIFYKHSNNIINLSNQLIYGIILISFITLVINFFYPLNPLANTLIFIIPTIIILKNLKTYLSFNFIKFIILNSIIIFLLISKSNIYRPDAILWLCKNASELTDGQISKLGGSTKGTVSLIRKRSYWNFSNLKPRDPVILALCTQEAFQKSLEKAKRRVEREKKAKIREEKKAQAASV